VCQLDTLAQCRNRAMLRKSLATLPQTLDQTYDRILTTISKQDRDFAMRILQWLTFSARPLSIKEIAEVVAIDVARESAFDRDEVLEDPLEALNICSSLVTVTSNKVEGRPDQQIITLAHYSVREYFVSDRIKQGSANEYSMQEAECHNAITKGSLKYLIQLQQPLSEETLQISALARYAAEFWSNHFRKIGEKVEELCQLAMDLMSVKNPAYLTWIQLYDPDSPWMELDLRKGLDSAAAPLYYAALLDLSTITRMLLDQGAEVNKQGGRYGNALHAASLRGHKHIVQTLIEAGAEVDAQNGDCDNALQAASSEGHELIVKMLLDNKANINAQGGKYGNALQAAAAAGHGGIVQLLLNNGADVNRQGGLYGNALNAAAAECHAPTVKLLLENAAEISRHDDQGRSVLHHATNSARCADNLVEFLLLQGAPANTINMENMTPLHYSVKFGHKGIAGLLLDNGLSIDAGVYRKTWSRNTVKTDPPYQISIPESKPDISCISAGLTPLHFAALTGNSVMTEFLLKRGADPNALSEYNESPMHLALRKTLHGPKFADDWTDQDWRVERLLDFLDFEDDNIDAVHANIKTHREGVLDAMLVDVRTSLTIRDYHHEYPLHCVEYGKSGSEEMIKKLVSRGANPFERNLKQQNALHLASRAGDHDAVAVLLSLGVDLALTDHEGLHALHHAARSGKYETITVLLEAAVATRPSLLVSKDALGRNLLHHLLSTTSWIQHETLQLLLDKGVDGSELDASGNSPLASYFKGHRLGVNVDICQQLLLVKGSSLFVDREGQNLGHLCALTSKCSVLVLETLREHGVDLTQRDLQSRTILHCAAMRGSITEESLHYLLHVVGVEKNAEDASGKTALQHATEMASKDRNPHIFDPGRWKRSEKLLSKSDVLQAPSRE
jgi:ankyrin repeat protein